MRARARRWSRPREVRRVQANKAPDSVYVEVSEQLGGGGLVDLAHVMVAINA